MKTKLIQKLSDKTAVIGIFGLGYVGLPLVLRYSDIGFKVIGFDIDEQKIEELQSGLSYIEHISSNRIGKARDSGFEATADFSRAAEVDALIFCVYPQHL